MTDVLDLDDVDAADATRVGNKAAVLHRLRRDGERVPPGLVLTTDAADASVAAFVSKVTERFDGPVAVRSSSRREDTRTRAAAGRTVTVLHVEGDDGIRDATRRCRDGGDGEVAVLVQPMLAPTAAGVAFSMDPVTGEREVVLVEAVAGVADQLLSGAVTGQALRVHGDTVRGDAGPLDDLDARAVAATTQRLEAALGRPQDVEWAVVDGVVHVLQSRPVTVVPIQPTLPAGDGWQKDVAHYPEPMTPFGFSVLRDNLAVMPEVFAAAGVMIDGLEEVWVGGEVYGRVKPAVGRPGGRPPPAPVLGLAARLAPELRRRNAAARRTLETPLLDRWVAAWVADRDRWRDRVATRHDIDLGALDDAALVAHGHDLQRLLRDGGLAHFRTFIPLTLALHRLHRACAEADDDWTPADTATLLAGASPTTSESHRDLAVVRRMVEATPGAADTLHAGPDDPVTALGPLSLELADQAASWIRRHGWRPPNYDAGLPTLAERPRLVTRLLQPTHEPPTGDTPPSPRPTPRPSSFDDLLRAARTAYEWREDTGVLAGDMVLGLVRRWLREVARRLVDRGRLPHADDAAMLHREELVDLLFARLPTARALDLVTRRRGEMAWARATPGPVTLGAADPAPDLSRFPTPLRTVNEAVLFFVGLEYPGDRPHDDADDDVLVRGTGSSPGVATGPVVVARSHADLDRLHGGEVLVCRTTDPAWAPLLSLAVAVVTDGGGPLSHVSIATRELGLPAVVGTGNATQVLVDGRVVTVDANAGVVRPT